MPAKKPVVVSREEFLRDAIQRSGLTRAGFAKRISVWEKTLDKWLAPAETSDFRNMPDVVWAYIREILFWGAKRLIYLPLGVFANWKFTGRNP
jgi:hypothetical protein